MAERFDFSGWATRNNLRCSDGRVIKRNAFKDNDGDVVPMFWQHDHSTPASVIGHALLENRDDGVYAYCALNNTEAGIAAREAVMHGDLDSLSIYANQLTQNGPDVIHGSIREVSLVAHGANPGAYIDNIIQHGDVEAYGEEGQIYNDEQINIDTPYYLCHTDDDSVYISNEDEDDYDLDDEYLDDEYEEDDDMYDEYDYDDEFSHADDDEDNGVDEETVADVFNAMTDKQKMVVYFMVGQALDENKGKKSSDEVEHSDYYEGGYDMKYNVFDQSEGAFVDPNVLAHAEDLINELPDIFAEAKRSSSLKDVVLAHAATYGIDNVDFLFPDAKNYTNTPEFISRDMEWVTTFLNSVKRSPFSRIKTIFADITADEARAKGYTKGNLKTNEVISLLKRTTVPTTIYKKQTMDRDDVIDITDFDVIAWIRQEMRTMLNEEIARACLVGDGRDIATAGDDKIDEACIRPIYTDADLYSIKVPVVVAANATEDAKAKAFIRSTILARKNYKGAGNPVLYTTEDTLNNLLLLEDGVGRRIYDTVDKLATALRVSKIVTVEVMEGLTRTDTQGKTRALAGIIVNPADYTIGADKGGQVNMFDDFDIDYNKMKYLIETRICGCLTKPYSAMVIEWETATAEG